MLFLFLNLFLFFLFLFFFVVLNCAGGSTKGLIEHLKRVHQILDSLKSGPTTSNQAQPSTSSTDNPPVKRQKLMTDFTRHR